MVSVCGRLFVWLSIKCPSLPICEATRWGFKSRENESPGPFHFTSPSPFPLVRYWSNLMNISHASVFERAIYVAVGVSLLACCAGADFGRDGTVGVRMRDGVEVRTRFRTPPGDGPWPVVFKKSYGSNMGGTSAYLGAGYAVVAQGSRRGEDPHGISGDTRFFADDVDGYDTIEWIARQPWCDGNVAMVGASYGGATQWLIAGNGDPAPPPHLKAIIPSAINPDLWERTYRAHGAMNLSMTAISRAFSNNQQATYENYMYLPLIDMDKAVAGRENTLWNEYVTHWHYESRGLNGQPYWPQVGTRDKLQRIKIPVFIYAGWWDYYAGASLEYFRLLTEAGNSPDVRVWIANTGHSGMHADPAIRWLDWIIKGQDTGFKEQPPVRLFVQETRTEQFFDQWPPKEMQTTKFYLHNPDGSRTGSLDTTPPRDETPTEYTYDPRDPVPSIGGNANHRSINKTLKSGALLKGGSFDQRAVEKREDVLVFTTSALEDDLSVVGTVTLQLFASTDARDTDFTAVLIDVRPDGKAMNVTEGIVRARFRESIWKAPKLLTPNETYEYSLELLPTARVFRKGHKIRLHLSSSRFPLWDRNTNTGNNPATDSEIKVARQTIYHDNKRPSYLVLPIIPGGSVDSP